MKFTDLKQGTYDNVIVLFCDIRNFTALCETVSIQEIAQLLDTYFKQMGGSILEHGGIVGRFVGDAIVGYFGLGESSSLAADQAIKAACEIMDRIKHIKTSSGDPILNGIGIELGTVVIKRVGPINDSYEHIVVGSPINRASRLEQLTRYSCHRLFISAHVHTLLSEEMKKLFIDLGEYDLRGYINPIHIFGEKLACNRNVRL